MVGDRRAVHESASGVRHGSQQGRCCRYLWYGNRLAAWAFQAGDGFQLQDINPCSRAITSGPPPGTALEVVSDDEALSQSWLQAL